MEPRVPCADPADAVLAHEHRGVEVVHLVSADVGQLRHGLLENRGVTTRRDQQLESRGGHQRGDEAAGLRGCLGRAKYPAVGADPQELIADVPGQEGGRRIAPGFLDPAAAGITVLGVLVRCVGARWCRRPALTRPPSRDRVLRGCRCPPGARRSSRRAGVPSRRPCP